MFPKTSILKHSLNALCPYLIISSNQMHQSEHAGHFMKPQNSTHLTPFTTADCYAYPTITFPAIWYFFLQLKSLHYRRLNWKLIRIIQIRSAQCSTRYQLNTSHNWTRLFRTRSHYRFLYIRDRTTFKWTFPKSRTPRNAGRKTLQIAANGFPIPRRSHRLLLQWTRSSTSHNIILNVFWIIIQILVEERLDPNRPRITSL